jgi:histidinol-phosphatase
VEELLSAFPDDGVLGEEGARVEGRSGRRWIVDPIDGTRDFLRGIPSWGHLIALEAEARVVVGVCHLAAQRRLHWAVAGEGAFLGAERLHVSPERARRHSVLCVTGLTLLAGHAFTPRLPELFSRFGTVRSMGGCQDAMLVVTGRAEAWLEMTGKAWDLAPMKLLAEEAGARFFNFDGGSSVHGGNAVICVPELERELRAFVAER